MYERVESFDLKGGFKILGEIRRNNFGTEMKIIKQRILDDIEVQFLDEHGYVKRNITYQNFKRGQVKNPYDKTVCNVGYLGDGVHKARKDKRGITQEYNIWKSILNRCYSEKYKNKYPAYYLKAIVCDEWLNFQNFAEWYKRNFYEVEGRLHLDKDILCPGNYIYSPDKCLLIPQKINEQIHYTPKKNGLPTGINLTETGKYSTSCNGIHLGTFSSLEEAYVVYALEKEKVIKNLANKYKYIIPTKTYDALYAFKLDLKNDKNYIAA